MSAIPISQATIRATERIRDVLETYLSAELAAVEAAEFPLPAPEQVICGRVDPSVAYQRLNIDEVAIWITKQAPSQRLADFSGDGTEREATVETQYQISLLIRPRPGFDYPTPAGWSRPMLEEEWMDRRAELYKGALIDTMTAKAENLTAIHQLNIDANEADVVEIEQLGEMGTATVIFTVQQDVLIKD